MVCKRVYLSGKVQGVGFRFHAFERASELGLNGWIKNLSDGRVEMVLAGEPSSVEAMIKWAHRGPPAAKVEAVEISETRENAKEPFHIKREPGA